MNCVRRQTHRQSKRLCWKGALQWKVAGWCKIATGKLICHVAHSLRFHDNEVSFQVFSGQSSCLCPSLVRLRVLPGGKHISQPRWIPAWGFLEGWRDIQAGVASLLVVRLEFWLVAACLQQQVRSVSPIGQDLQLWGNSCSVIILPSKGGDFSQ